MKRKLLMLVAFVSAVSTHSLNAHPGGHLPPILQTPEQRLEQTLIIPETLAGILGEVEKQMTLIQVAVKSQELSDARTPAMTIKILVRALGNKTESTSKVQDSVATIEALAVSVVNSSGAGAQKATSKNTSKLAAAISKLKSQMDS